VDLNNGIGRRLPTHNPECFACGVDSPAALQMVFEEIGGRVVVDVTFGLTQSGAPGYAHGGAIATALDDTIGTLLLSQLEQAGVTARLEIDYRRPVLLDVPLRIESWIERAEGRKVWPIAELRDGAELYSAARGLFILVDSDHFLGDARPAERWLELRRQGDPGLGR
jgi:acyl-coenzyme A thioesterase PaaI-like protein